MSNRMVVCSYDLSDWAFHETYSYYRIRAERYAKEFAYGIGMGRYRNCGAEMSHWRWYRVYRRKYTEYRKGHDRYMIKHPSRAAQKCRAVFTALLALWIAFIFANSLQVADTSRQMSGSALDAVYRLFAFLGIPWRPSEHFLRKAAHFLEYAVLGALAHFAVSGHTRAPKPMALALCAIGIAVPSIDETIQLLVPGRSGQVSDVLLDMGGVVFGIAIALLCMHLFRIKEKKFTG